MAPAFQSREAEDFRLPRIDPGEGLPQPAGEFLPCRSVERVSGVVVEQWRIGERPGPRRPAVTFPKLFQGAGGGHTAEQRGPVADLGGRAGLQGGHKRPLEAVGRVRLVAE